MLKSELVSEEELRRAKDHLKGSLMLSLESTSARMSNLARQEMYFGRFFSMDEILASIETVTRESMLEVAKRMCSTGRPTRRDNRRQPRRLRTHSANNSTV